MATQRRELLPPAGYLTRHQLADRLRVCIKTVDRLRHEKVGPPWAELAGRIIYPEAGVDPWLVEIQQQNSSPPSVRRRRRLLSRTSAESTA